MMEYRVSLTDIIRYLLRLDWKIAPLDSLLEVMMYYYLYIRATNVCLLVSTQGFEFYTQGFEPPENENEPGPPFTLLLIAIVGWTFITQPEGAKLVWESAGPFARGQALANTWRKQDLMETWMELMDFCHDLTQ